MKDDSISRHDAIDTINELHNKPNAWLDLAVEALEKSPLADVQPVTYCKDCQWCADVKGVNAGEMYHTCIVLGFVIPDGFACNKGKRKGTDE